MKYNLFFTAPAVPDRCTFLLMLEREQELLEAQLLARLPSLQPRDRRALTAQATRALQVACFLLFVKESGILLFFY